MILNAPIGFVIFLVGAATLSMSIFSTVQVSAPANISLATGVYQTLSAGFVKSTGPFTALVSAPTVVLSSNNDVSGILNHTHGGTDHAGPYTSGQLLVGNSVTGGLSVTTLTAGRGLGVTNGAGTISVAWAPKMYFLREQQTSGTAGGNATATTHRRALNAESFSAGAASILNTTDNTFTLPVGTYTIWAQTTAYNATVDFTAKLNLNLAAGGTEIYGTSEFGLAGTTVHPVVSGQFPITAGADTLELSMYISSFGSTTDMGKPATTGDPEIYTVVQIVQIA